MINLGAIKIKELHLGSIKIKEAYLGVTKVFGSALEFIKNSVCSISQIIEAYTLRQQTYTVLQGYNGITFRSSSSANGCKSVYYPIDVRPYSQLDVTCIHRSTVLNTGKRGLASIVVGTEAQIKALRYDDWSSVSGCTVILDMNTGTANSDNEHTASIDISSRASSSEPVYIGLRCNSYYGSTNTISIQSLTLS